MDTVASRHSRRYMSRNFNTCILNRTPRPEQSHSLPLFASRPRWRWASVGLALDWRWPLRWVYWLAKMKGSFCVTTLYNSLQPSRPGIIYRAA